MSRKRSFLMRALERMEQEEARQRERKEKLASGWYKEVRNRKTGEKDLVRLSKSQRPLCGAKTRSGGTCKARVVFGKRRCRLHGGLSTGAMTPEGRARIAESNRRRAKSRTKEESFPNPL